MDLIQYHECVRMRSYRQEIPMYLAGLAAVLTPVSIAAFEIVMGLAAVSLIATRTQWRTIPILAPLLLFFGWTVVSLAAHSNWHQGYPQIKKFYVYLMPFLIASAFREVRRLRWIVWGWALAASLSALWAMNQFYNKFEDARESHQDFYTMYVVSRISGFMSHWMTFSGHMMIALMVVGAALFFAPWRRWNVLLI